MPSKRVVVDRQHEVNIVRSLLPQLQFFGSCDSPMQLLGYQSFPFKSKQEQRIVEISLKNLIQDFTEWEMILCSGSDETGKVKVNTHFIYMEDVTFNELGYVIDDCIKQLAVPCNGYFLYVFPGGNADLSKIIEQALPPFIKACFFEQQHEFINQPLVINL